MKFRTFTSVVIAAILAPTVYATAAIGATVPQTFTVSTTFTPGCVTNNAAPSTIDFGAYTAYGTAANTAPTTTVSFKCSRAFTIVSAVFDTSGTVASSGAAGANPTAGGVVAGLQYTLATAAGVKSTTGTAASATSTGTGDVFSYVVTGTMAGGQAGCTNAGNSGDSCTATQTRTLTVSY